MYASNYGKLGEPSAPGLRKGEPHVSKLNNALIAYTKRDDVLSGLIRVINKNKSIINSAAEHQDGIMLHMPIGDEKTLLSMDNNRLCDLRQAINNIEQYASDKTDGAGASDLLGIIAEHGKPITNYMDKKNLGVERSNQCNIM